MYLKKNEIWGTLKQKISVSKVQKSKFWDGSFLLFCIPLVLVYSIFSLGAVFTEKFGRKITYFENFPKKKWKRGFLYSQICQIWNYLFSFISHLSYWPVREVRCRPLNFHQGLKNKDFPPWSFLWPNILKVNTFAQKCSVLWYAWKSTDHNISLSKWI